MLPVGKGQGQLWKGDTMLCNVHYEITEPLPFITVVETQHLKMILHDYDCEQLLDVAGLILVLADGRRQRLPRPINAIKDDGLLECFLSADVT